MFINCPRRAEGYVKIITIGKLMQICMFANKVKNDVAHIGFLERVKPAEQRYIDTHCASITMRISNPHAFIIHRDLAKCNTPPPIVRYLMRDNICNSVVDYEGTTIRRWNVAVNRFICIVNSASACCRWWRKVAVCPRLIARFIDGSIARRDNTRSL